MTARTPGNIPLRDAKPRCNIPSTPVQFGSTWTRAPEASASLQFTAGGSAMPVPWRAAVIRISRLPVARRTQNFPRDLGQVLEARLGGFACGFAGDVHQLASSAKAVKALGRRAAIAALPLRQPGARLGRLCTPIAVIYPRVAARICGGGPRCLRGVHLRLLWPALATLGGSGSQARDVRVQALDDDEAAPAERYGFEFTFSEQLPHFVLPMFPSSARARGTGMSRGLTFVIGALLIPRPHWSRQRLERPCLIVIALQRR
jgi:hypothetical protein